jgi:hypothetical protein
VYRTVTSHHGVYIGNWWLLVVVIGGGYDAGGDGGNSR